MKILHLASFCGNIGDVANHESFYHQLRMKISTSLEITQLEIRDYYQNLNLKQFDKEFVESVNRYDLFIIGGGNFFELCWDYSENGTTFNISNELLKEIKTPILINGIGIDDNKGINENNIKKFKLFLDTLFTYTKVYFSVRNDGSKEIFDKYFPERADLVHEIPDFGFFLGELDLFKENESKFTKYIGINVAIDMPEIRYQEGQYEKYLSILASQIDKILEDSEYNIFMFAHIQTDYTAILELLERVTYKQARFRISIAPLIHGEELNVYKYYQRCDFIFGMRFHSNVCSIGLNIPSYGIVSYPKHEKVFEKIDLESRKCNVNARNFEAELEKQRIAINDPLYLVSIKQLYEQKMKQLSKIKNMYLDSINMWLKE